MERKGFKERESEWRTHGEVSDPSVCHSLSFASEPVKCNGCEMKGEAAVLAHSSNDGFLGKRGASGVCGCHFGSLHGCVNQERFVFPAKRRLKVRAELLVLSCGPHRTSRLSAAIDLILRQSVFQWGNIYGEYRL